MKQKPIKPYPFCGTKLTRDDIYGCYVCQVSCYRCGAEGGSALTEAWAIRKWNRRVKG